MDEGKKLEQKIEKKEKKFVSNIRKNPWMLVSMILAIVAIILLIYSLAFASSDVSGSKAAQNVLDYAKTVGITATLDSVESQGSFYQVNLIINSQPVPVFVSKDGKFMIQPVAELVAKKNATTSTDTTPATSVPKADKPKVELFVMSYCPYGTQAEKGLIPVIQKLGSKADITIRFVHYTMHGEKEDIENSRQLCIREEQNSKFVPYLLCILNSSDPNSPADPTACMKKVGVDSTKVNTCMASKAADYYKVDSALSEGYGVQGSPTLVINGVQSNSGRSPSAFLDTICSAFTDTKVPSECNSQMDTANPSAGFGLSSTSSGSSAAQCG